MTYFGRWTLLPRKIRGDYGRGPHTFLHWLCFIWLVHTDKPEGK